MPLTAKATTAFPYPDFVGEPSWIEGPTGFPARSWGDNPTNRPNPALVLASTASGEFTGHHAGNLVAFTEFLAGVALDSGERDWLIDAMTREFEAKPARSMAELKTIAFATHAVPLLEPLVRADNRQKALTSSYQLDVHRKRAGMAPNPVMALIQAHNPAVLVDDSGVVVTADAVEARNRINQIILALAGQRLDDQPHLRADLAARIEQAPTQMKAELAGSWIRLVILRAWLSGLEPGELFRLRTRAAEVVDTATDLDLVGLMLSFRAMVEAVLDDDDDDDDDE